MTARVALIALVAYPLVALGFTEVLGAPVLDALLLALLVELLPALAVAQVFVALRLEVVDRLSAYASSAVSIAVLGGAALVLGLLEGGPERLGVQSTRGDLVVGATLATLAGAGAVVGLFHLAQRAWGLAESPLLVKLLPATDRERIAFAGLSFVAGFGEEIAFRGYAIPALAPLLGGAWGAAVFTAAAFGVLHAYQGLAGMVRAALLGVVLAAPFLLLGTLWPGVAAHVIVDLVGGFWLGPRLAREGAIV